MVNLCFLLRKVCLLLVYLGLNEPGIFRRAALVSLIKQVQEKYNEGFNKRIRNYSI